MSTANRDNLQPLPPEILSIIFGHVDPKDLLSLSLVCPKFRETIMGNKMMFKSVYLRLLDTPPTDMINDKWDWEDEVHKFSTFRRMLTSPDWDKIQKKTQISVVHEAVMKMMQCADPKSGQSINVKFLRAHISQDLNDIPMSNLEIFCCQSSLFSRARIPVRPHSDVVYNSDKARQLSAKLHVYLGSPIKNIPGRSFAPLYPYAISKVYDLRNYTPESLWGPYRPDGLASVDWEKMEAIMIVIGHNVKDFRVQANGKTSPLWSFNWDGCTPNSYVHRPLSRSFQFSSDDKVDFVDPYNITGSWMRVVTFLDFHELFHYNFSTPPPALEVPRPAHSTREACRLIMMELRVTHQEKPGPDDGQDLPIVHFTGDAHLMSSGLDPNANSKLTGTVRQTKEGEIRWTTLSVYGGETRWKSECIQVGGLNSGRGVLGHWFDKDFEPTGPAGPTAFWKISDDIDDPSQRTRSDGFHSDEDPDDALDAEEDEADVEESEAEVAAETEAGAEEEQDAAQRFVVLQGLPVHSSAILLARLRAHLASLGEVSDEELEIEDFLSSI